jgi:hypothetical protein
VKAGARPLEFNLIRTGPLTCACPATHSLQRDYRRSDGDMIFVEPSSFCHSLSTRNCEIRANDIGI